jgi:homoprotocatechuate degradation regulator HpaR
MKLLRARDMVMQRFRPHLRAQGLTDQQGRILRVLAEVDQIEMGALSLRTSIHSASLSRIVPGLCQKGIVTRSKIDADARRVLVSITKRGRAIIEPVVRASELIYAELANELGPNRWRELHRCLDLLINTGDNSGETADLPQRRRNQRATGTATTRLVP